MKTPRRLLSLVVIGILPCCSTSADDQSETNKEVVRQLVAAINHGDFDTLDQLVAEDVVRHSQATPGVEVRSREDFKRFLRQDLATFPDAHQEIEILVAENDKVAMYLTLTGTQQGPIGPYPASGDSVDVKFLGIMRLEDGKVAEIWAEWDNLNILTQLGHYAHGSE